MARKGARTRAAAENHPINRRISATLNIIRVYTPNASNLCQFLERVLDENGRNTLKKIKDKEFSDFLEHTLIAPMNSLAPIVSSMDCTSMNEVISRTIGKLLANGRFSRQPVNLLCLGFRPATEGAQTTQSGIENYYPNTLIHHLKSVCWTTLLNVIGDTGMSIILEGCHIFVKLGIATYLQVCGTPLSEMQPFDSKPVKQPIISRHQTIYARVSDKQSKIFFRLAPRNKTGTGKDFFKYFFLSRFKQEKMDQASSCFPELKRLAKTINKRHRTLPYQSLLDHCCPVVDEEKDADFLSQSESEEGRMIRKRKDKNVAVHLGKPILSYSETYNAVSQFLKKALCKVLPKSLQEKPFIKHVHRLIDFYVRLRRFEAISIHALVKGMAMKNLPKTLQNPKIFESFMFWLFDGYLVPLIRRVFYVTDTGAHRSKVFYFRQDVWKQINCDFLESLKEKMFRPAEVTAASRKIGWGELGSCNLRLVPKSSTFRPVMNLRKRRAAEGSVHGISVNAQLKNVHEVLNYAVKLNPKLLGSSDLGLDEVAAKIAEYKRKADIKAKPLFMVKIDFKSCFDTIPHEKLLHLLVHQVLPKEDFQIHKFDVVKSIDGRARKLFKKFASPSSDFSSLADHTNIVQGRSKSPKILIDKVVGSFTDRRTILKLLYEHICCNHVKIGGELYVQSVGIPQGSILSAILCSLLYGDMDQKHLSRFLSDPESLLMRFIDDMILITTSYQTAADFLQTILPGFAEYGIEVNKDKVATNFFHPLVSASAKVSPAEPFQWCGMLIDQDTLELRSDYSKFFGSYISDSLTIQRIYRPAEAFSRQLKIYLKPKFKSVFMSLEINSPATVSANIYQAFLFTALKAHVYLRELRHSGIVIRPDIVIKAVEEACEFGEGLFRNLNEGRAGSSVLGTVRWMGMYAFNCTFERKPSSYRGLILDRLGSEVKRCPPRPWQICFDKIFAESQQLFKAILH